MFKTLRVVDLQYYLETETYVVANTAEGAARKILGMDLIGGGNKRAALVAKVYSTTDSVLTMVRLYQRTESDDAPHI